MARINSIKLINYSFSGNDLQTKRQCLDNSDIYISSKLSKLYQQAIADSFVKSKTTSIKKFIDKS